MRTHFFAPLLIVALILTPLTAFAGLAGDDKDIYIEEDSSPKSQDTVTAPDGSKGNESYGGSQPKSSVSTNVTGCDNATYQRALAGDKAAQKKCTPCGTVTYQDYSGKKVTCAKNEGCSVPKCSTAQMQQVLQQGGSQTGGSTTQDPTGFGTVENNPELGGGSQGIQNAFSEPIDHGEALWGPVTPVNDLKDVLGAGWLSELGGVGGTYLPQIYTPITSDFLGGIYMPNTPALSTPVYSFSYSPAGVGANSFMPKVSFQSLATPGSFNGFGSAVPTGIYTGSGFFNTSAVTLQPVGGLSYTSSFGAGNGLFNTMQSYYSPTLGTNISTSPFLNTGLSPSPTLSSSNSIFGSLLSPTLSGPAQTFAQGGILDTTSFAPLGGGAQQSFTPIKVQTVSPGELAGSVTNTMLSPISIADLENTIQGGGTSIIQQLQVALGDAAPTPTVVRTFSITPVSMADVVEEALRGNFDHASELLGTAMSQAATNIGKKAAEALGQVAPRITDATNAGSTNLPENGPIPEARPNTTPDVPTTGNQDVFPDAPASPNGDQGGETGQPAQQPQNPQQQPQQQPQMPQGGGGQPQQPQSTLSPQEPRVVQFSCNPSAVLKSGVVSVVWGCGGGARTSAGTGFDSEGSLSGSLQVTVATTTQLGISCNGDVGTTPATRTCSVRSVSPKIVVIAVPSEVSSGGSANIAWVTTETNGCTLYGPEGRVKNGAAGVARIDNLTQSSQFALVCGVSGAGETVRQDMTVTVAGSQEMLGAVVSENTAITPSADSSAEDDGETNTDTAITPNDSGTFTATDENGNAISLCDPGAGISKFTACLLSSF